VTKQDGGCERHRGEQHDTGERDDVQAVQKRQIGGVEDVRRQPVAKANGAAERAVGCGRRSVPGEIVPVQGGAERAEQRDPERAAELVTGLCYAGRRTRPARRPL
jgi:hypothetical protein